MATEWGEDTVLSDLAKMVAKSWSCPWQMVATYTERCIEGGTWTELGYRTGLDIERIYDEYAAALGKPVEELDDLEKRVAILNALLEQVDASAS